jgi:hypothetical protein
LPPEICKQALKFRIVPQQLAAGQDHSVDLLFTQGEAGRDAVKEQPLLGGGDVNDIRPARDTA